MKSFLWRLRSNACMFLLAMVIFTGIYLPTAYSDLRYFYLNFCFSHIDPFLVSLFVSFGFFMLYTKRYTYDEEYLYGHSRKSSFFAAQCAAVVFALMFACYALGVALLVRRSFFTENIVGTAAVYNISAAEIFLNFISLFIVNMLMFETADILRKFKTWKFWAVVAVLVMAVIAVCYVYVKILPLKRFDYWMGMFVIFLPLFAVAAVCDWFMTRGKQCR